MSKTGEHMTWRSIWSRIYLLLMGEHPFGRASLTLFSTSGETMIVSFPLFLRSCLCVDQEITKALQLFIIASSISGTIIYFRCHFIVCNLVPCCLILPNLGHLIGETKPVHQASYTINGTWYLFLTAKNLWSFFPWVAWLKWLIVAFSTNPLQASPQLQIRPIISLFSLGNKVTQIALSY